MRRLARLAWFVCATLGVATIALLVLDAGESTRASSAALSDFGGLSFVVAALAFATVGATVMERVPGNSIGPIFLGTALLLSAGDLAFQYAARALFISPELPGGATAAWLQNLGSPGNFGLLAVTLLLFPDGRLPSRRWRPALWLALAGIGLIFVGYALRSGPLDEPFDGISNPFGVGTRGLFDAATALGWLLMAASVGVAAVAMVIRLRHARGLERQQLTWIASAAAVAGVLVVGDAATYFAGVEGIKQPRELMLGLGFAVFPLAAGAAILRYRLYDIDVVINRALVYGVLTAVLAGAYVIGVLLLQLLLSPSSDIAVAGSTLAVAALFRPARSRIQGAVDRRFYRHRYDAQRTLEAFSARIRDQVDLDSLSADLRAVVVETMQPAHVWLWQRPSETR